MLPLTIKRREDFDAAFPNEESAMSYLRSVRFKGGEACLVCGSPRLSFLNTRKLWKCLACYKQFSITKGTIFEATKIPLTTWLLTIWMTEGGRCRTAVELSQRIDVTPKTAELMLSRLHAAFAAGSFFVSLKGEKKANRPRCQLSVGQLSYPFVSNRRDNHSDLLSVNKLVPHGIPGREDICQELMLALLDGQITLTEIRANPGIVRAFIRKFKNQNYESRGYALSLDEPMPDGRSWHNVLASKNPDAHL